ncbi:MAG: hypothetical protein E6H06_20675 [Bacteroidetes bacterium]|nr:MAG: hypothetical protein E6H06_20675 [Bacteroidota bacterium]
MSIPKISVDFNNADTDGRLRLSTNGALADIKRMHIQLQDGLEVILNDNEGLEATGIIEFSQTENIWVAKIDWNKIKNI